MVIPMADNFEMIPHKLLADLQYDVEALKKRLLQPDAKVNELILEIESMKDTVHELTSIFQKALQEMKEEGDVATTVKVMKEQLEAIAKQNETIAKGMIAISDKVDDWMQGASGSMTGAASPIKDSILPTNIPHMGPPPSVATAREALGGMSVSPGRIAPSMDTPASFAGSDDFPPPPPRMSNSGKKKGFGNLFH